MKPRKNVLLIVVDQWRGDTLPMMGHHIHLLDPAEPKAPSVIRALDAVEAVEVRDGRTVISTTDSEQVVKTLLDLDPNAHDLTVATASLEEVLIAMTHHEEVLT